MDAMFDFANKLNQFGLSDAELGILCAITICSPGKNSLEIDNIDTLNVLSCHVMSCHVMPLIMSSYPWQIGLV